jgi:hypothetical protein
LALKPFRTIPKDIVEWTKWMQDQDDVASSVTAISSSTSSPSSTTTVNQSWSIEDIDGDYSLSNNSQDTVYRQTSSSASDITVEPNIFGEGEQVVILRYGTGAVTIVAGTGVTIRTPSTLTINEQYGSVTLILIGDNEWMIAGRMTP